MAPWSRLCDRPIPRPGESYRMFLCHWVWSGATRTFCTDDEEVEVRLRKK